MAVTMAGTTTGRTQQSWWVCMAAHRPQIRLQMPVGRKMTMIAKMTVSNAVDIGVSV